MGHFNDSGNCDNGVLYQKYVMMPSSDVSHPRAIPDISCYYFHINKVYTLDYLFYPPNLLIQLFISTHITVLFLQPFCGPLFNKNKIHYFNLF